MKESKKKVFVEKENFYDFIAIWQFKWCSGDATKTAFLNHS